SGNSGSSVRTVCLGPARWQRAGARDRSARGRVAPRSGAGRFGAGAGHHLYHFAAREDDDGGRGMSQQPSILIVDDESGILDTLRILLRKEGFEITTAQGGKAGLEQI